MGNSRKVNLLQITGTKKGTILKKNKHQHSLIFINSVFSAKFCKGCYAVSVTGVLPPGIVRELKSKGIIYRPRDTSEKS
jgi:transcription elongation factor SPT4